MHRSTLSLDVRVAKEEWSLPLLKHELENDPGNAIKKYRVVFAEGKGVSWTIEKTFNWLHHKKVEDVESWLNQNVAGLRI